MHVNRPDPEVQAGVVLLCGFVLPTAGVILFLRPAISTIQSAQLPWWAFATYAVGLSGIFVGGALRMGPLRYWLISLSGVFIESSIGAFYLLRAWWTVATLIAIMLIVFGFATRIALHRERGR